MRPAVDTTPSPVDFRSRARCTNCDNTGIVSELRVIWKMPREEMAPSKHWRRVDAESAPFVMEALRKEGAFDIELLSGARPCSCRKPIETPRPVGRPSGKPMRPDWKTLCAGGGLED